METKKRTSTSPKKKTTKKLKINSSEIEQIDNDKKKIEELMLEKTQERKIKHKNRREEILSNIKILLATIKDKRSFIYNGITYSLTDSQYTYERITLRKDDELVEIEELLNKLIPDDVEKIQKDDVEKVIKENKNILEEKDKQKREKLINKIKFLMLEIEDKDFFVYDGITYSLTDLKYTFGRITLRKDDELVEIKELLSNMLLENK